MELALFFRIIAVAVVADPLLLEEADANRRPFDVIASTALGQELADECVTLQLPSTVANRMVGPRHSTWEPDNQQGSWGARIGDIQLPSARISNAAEQEKTFSTNLVSNFGTSISSQPTKPPVAASNPARSVVPQGGLEKYQDGQATTPGKIADGQFNSPKFETLFQLGSRRDRVRLHRGKPYIRQASTEMANIPIAGKVLSTYGLEADQRLRDATVVDMRMKRKPGFIASAPLFEEHVRLELAIKRKDNEAVMQDIARSQEIVKNLRGRLAFIQSSESNLQIAGRERWRHRRFVLYGAIGTIVATIAVVFAYNVVDLGHRKQTLDDAANTDDKIQRSPTKEARSHGCFGCCACSCRTHALVWMTTICWCAGLGVMWHYGVVQPFLKQFAVVLLVASVVVTIIALGIVEAWMRMRGQVHNALEFIELLHDKCDNILESMGFIKHEVVEAKSSLEK